MLLARMSSVSPLQLQRADDDVRGAHELADANHCRIGEDGGRRHLQPFERGTPLFARDRVGAERVQVVGEQHRRGLGQPEDPAVARDVLERHDQDARPRLRLRADAEGERAREGGSENRAVPHASPPPSCDPLLNAMLITHAGSPVPRHASTSARVRRLNNVSRRVKAAA